MVRPSLPLLTTTAAAFVAAADDGNSCSANSLEVDYPAPVAAKGWSYRLVANNFARPRGILFDSEGGLIVVDSGTGLVHLRIKDDGGDCVSVDERKTLIENEDLNHGIALSQDGSTLYASTANEAFSWSYDARAARLTSSSRRTLITNMSNPGHTSRTLLLSRKQPDYLLVSRGSYSNEDSDTEDVGSGRSQIRAFNISALDDDSDPYDYLDGDVLGWGLRNSVGVAEHPVDGGIWSVENSVDELHRNGVDIHQDNPGEELNFHGYLNDPSSLSGDEGGNYGYPLCYAIWSTDNFPDLGNLTTGDQFPGAETSRLTDEACNSDYTAPVLVFQAHTAPLDIKFAQDGSQAFISFHGSWNRDDPVGYRIASVAFEDGKPTAPSDSTDAATSILRNPDLSNCPDECFRPVGLAWDSNDRLWFSSDSTGEIFVLVHDGNGTSGDGSGDSSDEGSSSGGDDGDDSAAAQILPSGTGMLVVALAAMVVGLFLS